MNAYKLAKCLENEKDPQERSKIRQQLKELKEKKFIKKAKQSGF